MTELEMQIAVHRAVLSGDSAKAHEIADAYFYDLYKNLPTEFVKLYEMVT